MLQEIILYVAYVVWAVAVINILIAAYDVACRGGNGGAPLTIGLALIFVGMAIIMLDIAIDPANFQTITGGL